jgi:hypothetical protein
MRQEVRALVSHDSFPDALQSEIVAGTSRLRSWIRQIQVHGAAESLFCLETWLRGTESFLDKRGGKG